MTMGEMPEVSDRTEEVIAQGLDSAFDAVDPQSKPAPVEDVVEETVEPEEEEAEEREEEEEEEVSQDEDVDPRVAPVIQRIKAGTVTENDIEMISRWRARADEAKDLKAALASKKTAGEAEQYILDMAKEHEGGEDYFAKHGAKATLEQIIKVRAQEEASGEYREDAPVKSADDRRVREIEARLDAREAAEAEQRFNNEVASALKGIKELSPSHRDYVRRQVIATAYMADPDQDVGDFVREVAQDFLNVAIEAKKAGKAEAITAGKQKAAVARPGKAPSEPTPKKAKQKSMLYDSLNPMQEMLSEGLDSAVDKIFGEISAT